MPEILESPKDQKVWYLAQTHNMHVRLATPKDLDFLVRETKAFSQFYDTKKSLFPGEELARAGLEKMMTEHLVMISETSEGILTGFIAGYYLKHPFNPSLQLLSETFWWVTEKFRLGRSGLLLLNAFIEFGNLHADWTTMSLEHNSPVKAESLISRGFKLREQAFLKESV